jgi:ketosteroid isomerase-like protein
LEAWFPTFTGPVGYEVRDLRVETCGDLAVSTSLDRITGSRTNGDATDVWVRATIVYRKLGGRWVVVHEHRSVPFYMDGSLKAAIDLAP